jgi:Erv1 / Alr family
MYSTSGVYLYGDKPIKRDCYSNSYLNAYSMTTDRQTDPALSEYYVSNVKNIDRGRESYGGIVNPMTNNIVNPSSIEDIESFGKVVTDPKIWGPMYWYTLHTSAAQYPENPSNIVKKRTKDRILAIPYELPCPDCRCHAISYIQNKKDELDKAVSDKENLVKFYVDFHNEVNKRLNKKEFTYEEALKKYG